MGKKIGFVNLFLAYVFFLTTPHRVGNSPLLVYDSPETARDPMEGQKDKT